MAAVRDSLCELGRLEIPRPKCQGMQWVATRGKMGFYKSIRANGAQFGLQVKDKGPRRPKLSDDLFRRPETLAEEPEPQTPSPTARVVPQAPPSPPEDPPAPDYPVDYVPRHLRNTKGTQL